MFLYQSDMRLEIVLLSFFFV